MTLKLWKKRAISKHFGWSERTK